MDEDQGRASPPLPSSRGSYNIDFDAIDDSFNPFQTKRFIRNSPPPCRREPSSNADSESVAQESHQAESESRLQDSGSSCLLKETSEAPKKRKSKSPSGKQAALARDAETCPGSDDSQSAGNLVEDAAAAAAAAAVAEKPVKPRKVVRKPKSRPSSKNLEGQGCAERLKPSDEPETSAAPAAGNDNEATLPQPTSTSSDIPQDAMTVQEPSNPLLEKASPQTGKTSQNSEKTPQQSEEKILHEPETALPLPESTRPRSASGASEEGAEGTPKKERSAGKVKKSKTKARKSSSSPRPVSSGDVDGVDSPVRTAEESTHTAKHDKESKSLPRASFEGDGVGSHDSAVDSDVHKPKHPAARVLEQKVLEDSHSQSISRNNLPNDSEDDFYDAFDSPPPVATHMMDPMQSYSDMNDSCMLFQSHDHLGGLSWAQEEGGLLDEGAGEAAFAEDLTIVRNGPGIPHVAWLPTVMQPT